MKNKVLLGLGALALVGTVIYFNKKKKSEKTSNFRGKISSSSCSSDSECTSPQVCHEGQCTILKQHPPILSYSNVRGRFVNSGVGVYNPQIYSKLKSGEKICNCAYLNKPEKICSKSVRCNDCCEGSGIGGHRDTVVTRD